MKYNTWILKENAACPMTSHLDTFLISFTLWIRKKVHCVPDCLFKSKIWWQTSVQSLTHADASPRVSLPASVVYILHPTPFLCIYDAQPDTGIAGCKETYGVNHTEVSSIRQQLALFFEAYRMVNPILFSLALSLFHFSSLLPYLYTLCTLVIVDKRCKGCAVTFT